VLDDGRLTDNKGRMANFKNTIIIMTSNIGSHIIQEKLEDYNDFNKEDKIAEAKAGVMDLLKHTIRPEFLNRIDDVMMFTPLSRENVREIVNIQFKSLQQTMAEQGMEISATDEALDWLSQLGYDPQFGARPLKRVMQKRILNELSKQILMGNIKKDSSVLIKLNDKNQFEFVNE
jgi:ATP-dependent Clp protease ATP-binding subunit ClpB